MFLLRCLKLLWIVPCSWIDALLIRKKPIEVRYAHMRSWSKRLMKAFHVQLQIHQEEALPQDVPLLFVGNHQSEFDMLIQMAAIDLPFSFISKVENQKTPYVGSWSKTLDVLFFDREDQGSGIHMIREATRRLKAGKRMLIYPEGTRSKGKKMQPMHPGSLQPAFLAKASIVALVVENSYDYKRVFMHKGCFHIHVLRSIPFEEYKPFKVDGITQKLQQEMQELLDHKLS